MTRHHRTLGSFLFTLMLLLSLGLQPRPCKASIVPESAAMGGESKEKEESIIEVVSREAGPRDAVGEFQADWERSNPQCPYIVIHRQQFLEESVFVPHTTMKMNGRSCLDGFSTQVFGANANEAYATVEVDNPARELITNVSAVDDLVPLYAYEPNGRLCGNDASNSRLRRGTVIVFLKPDSPANISDWLEVVPGLTYMVTMSSVERCIYTLNGIKTPSPSPSPATPEPSIFTDDASATEELVTVDDGDADSIETPLPDSGTPPSDPVASSPPTPTGSTFGAAASPSDSSDSSGDSREGSAACFPADATVQLADDRRLRMADLKIGHVVRIAPSRSSSLVSSRVHLSPIYMFSHRMPSATYRFISLTTASARNIMLTAGHYLFVNHGVSAASAVRVGDTLLGDDGAGDRVVSVKSVVRTGLFNPHTSQGTLVVNGIVTTTFTTAVQPYTAQALLAPLRALHSSLGWSCSLFDAGAESYLPFVPRGRSSVL